MVLYNNPSGHLLFYNQVFLPLKREVVSGLLSRMHQKSTVEQKFSDRLAEASTESYQMGINIIIYALTH